MHTPEANFIIIQTAWLFPTKFEINILWVMIHQVKQRTGKSVWQSALKITCIGPIFVCFVLLIVFAFCFALSERKLFTPPPSTKKIGVNPTETHVDSIIRGKIGMIIFRAPF